MEKLPDCHPKILALKKCLQGNRNSIDETPTGVIELTLPRPIQTVANKIIRKGKKNLYGNIVIVVKLIAYQNAYTVKKEDQAVVFFN